MFEFTENERFRDIAHVKRIIAEYRRQGFLTALDDFGAGYAGLSLLANFRTDLIKIDMDLLRGIDADAGRGAIVAGSPARVVKMRFPDALIERYLKVQWWRYAFWDLRQCSITDPEQFIDAVEARSAEGMQAYNPGKIALQSLVPTG